MSKVEFKLNRAGVRELLKSSEMRAIIDNHTSRVLNAAGGAGKGYEANVRDGQNRIVSTVRADTIQAKRSNAKHNTLLKALHK